MFKREAVMRVIALSDQECSELLKRVSIGRLGCSFEGQPYVVPVAFRYEPDSIYLFSTLGQKIEWMRQNPKVCLQIDEIGNHSNWLSAIITGTYSELLVPQQTAQRDHARELLAQNTEWWLNPLAERRRETGDLSIEPVFFRIDIQSITGLRAMSEAD
jgi:nitroimidazol reductase NimA-like FMN-containing flavoprotein (pyridoxamine 5'-phosphate oxidase superfamily)